MFDERIYGRGERKIGRRRGLLYSPILHTSSPTLARLPLAFLAELFVHHQSRLEKKKKKKFKALRETLSKVFEEHEVSPHKL